MASTITLTGVVRDFKSTMNYQGQPNLGGHPDFENSDSAFEKGRIKSELGSDSKPIYISAFIRGKKLSKGRDYFDQWYRDVDGVNLRLERSITLKLKDGVYTYDSKENSTDGLGGFFPIDDDGFGKEWRSHNYSFTYEIHAYFTYQGNGTLAVTSDDDSWVFIDNKLVIDLGGLHGAKTQKINLARQNLRIGKTYRFDLFFAERHTKSSVLCIETSLVLTQLLAKIIASKSEAHKVGAVPGEFTVNLNSPAPTDVTVNYTVTGDAVAGADYQPLSGHVTFAKGESSKTITVAPIGTAPVGISSKTVGVTLQPGAGYFLDPAGQSTANVTIRDQVLPTVSIEATQPNAHKVGSVTGEFTVKLNAAAPWDLTVYYTAAGDAISGTDYEPLSGSVTFLQGESSKTIPVNPIGTAPIGNSSSNVIVTLEGDCAYELDPAKDSATVTITDQVTSDIPPDPATVAPPLDQTVATDFEIATEFLYAGTAPIQTGVAPGTIEAKRVVVLRGRVLDQTGQPLPGVTVTVLNYPEFGQTKSRADGMFDLVVNGGGRLTVCYQKEGVLSAQRSVETPWRDYVWLPDVVLIPRDPVVTAIDLGATASIQAARGSVVSDNNNQRQATVLIPQGMQASIILPNGSTQPLHTLNIRITEYTVGDWGLQAMPAELPPQTAYTYAFEITADEAVNQGIKQNGRDVLLDRPVFFYVDNFLDFPTGINVPTGYYDNDRAAWISSENGRVINVQSVTNGLADLDVDGTNQPASENALQELGFTDAERQYLAENYPVNASLWRVPLSHFSNWDCNWGCEPDCDPVQEGCSCKPDAPPIIASNPIDDPCEVLGSRIESQNQILGETIDLSGTPYSLHYRGDRTNGFQPNRTLKIPLSGNRIPSTLQRILLEVYVAGQRFYLGFRAAPNQVYSFVWDGMDAYGRPVSGAQPVLVRIGYVYGVAYVQTGRFGYNGNGAAVTGVRGREFLTLWQQWSDTFNFPVSYGKLGGWNLSVHHAYDSEGQILYRGDGTRRNAKAICPNIIETVAGNGASAGSGGDGNCATTIGVEAAGIAVGPDGNFYFADGYSRVRFVTPDGIIHTLAGISWGAGGEGGSGRGFAGDGGPASQALLSDPTDVAIGPDGSIYIADYGNRCIRRVFPHVNSDGTGEFRITTIAGRGSLRADGIPATQVAFDGPRAVTVGPDGSVYVAECPFNGRGPIYRLMPQLNPDGSESFMITAVAGGGTLPFQEGIVATQTTLHEPHSIAVGADGSLYIANADRIYRVGPDGVMTTVVNQSNSCGYSGDEGLAIAAQIAHPCFITLGPDQSLYLADASYCVRCVSPDGLITTLAGTGEGGYGGDGGWSSQALLEKPQGLAISPDGSLYIAESSRRIRKVSPPNAAGLSLSEILVPSEDGSELYVFTSTGRHLRTVDGLTGELRYQFCYDSCLLIEISDGDGNITRIERDTDGNPMGILGPYGHRTVLALNTDGYLASVTNSAGEQTCLTYKPDGLGLLETLRDPRGYTYQFEYCSDGRLRLDTDPAGGFQLLDRTELDYGYYVTRVTSLARETRYQVESLTTGGQRFTNTFACGRRATLKKDTQGNETTTLPDGTTTVQTMAPDLRWGVLAPLVASTSMTTQSGLKLEMTQNQQVHLANPHDLLSLRSLTTTSTVNGRATISVYNAPNNGALATVTDTTPAGRRMITTLDEKGRVVVSQVTGLCPTYFEYDARGRLRIARQGTGSELRQLLFEYYDNSAPSAAYNGYLRSITDPLGRQVTFDEYDGAGRVRQQTLPGNRVITYTYDANGNVESITPPGRPAHRFTYTPVDLQESYIPPVVAGSGTNQTRYAYNAERQLEHVRRPDGESIDLTYDGAGRLGTLTTARGTTTYTYYDNARGGNLDEITTPDGVALTYTYDSALLTSVQWSGGISGTVSYSYDNNFRVTSTSVNSANTIAYEYDADGLLLRAGDLTLHRNPQNGLLTGTEIGVVTDTLEYNDFGELKRYTACASGNALYTTDFVRDNLNRITQKAETILGVTTTYVYDYDDAGRLHEVTENGTVVEHYEYDGNGNRLSATVRGNTSTGTYDDQDRLLQYGGTSYTYTANGELQSATINGQTTTYDYDALGNLRGVGLPDGTQISYLIDGQNRRIGRRVNGVLVQGFLYQGQLRPIAELDGNGNIISRLIYATHINVPDYMIRGGISFRIITDHLGSPRLIINTATGNVVQQIDYDSFGNTLCETNPGFQPFGFAGGLYDAYTKLTHFCARDYEEINGRWNTKDLIAFAGKDVNLYAYASNNPPNRIDVLGLTPGTPYETPRQAALQAFMDIWVTSYNQDVEYGGLIYRTPDNHYTYTPAVTDYKKTSVHTLKPEDLVCSSRGTPVATYHTHGRYRPGQWAAEMNENFSNYQGSGDIPNAVSLGLDSYLLTPAQKLLEYNHKTFEVITENLTTGKVSLKTVLPSQ